MIKVASLGTCRVYDALFHLQKENKVRILPRFWGYPHNSSEVLQNLRYVYGELPFPADNHDVYNLPHLHGDHFSGGTRNVKQCIEDADIIFIEVSSLKNYMFRGYVAQGNRLAEKLDVSLFDVDKILLKDQKVAIPKEKLASIKEFQATYEDLDFVKQNLKEILQKLAHKKVIFTTTFTVSDDKRYAFVAREQLREIVFDFVSDACSKGYDVIYYNPSLLLDACGMPIKDYSHYSLDFVSTLAKQYWRLIKILEPDKSETVYRSKETSSNSVL